MKKYIWLTAVTAALSLAAWLIGRAAGSNVPQVTVTRVATQHVEQTVQASGRVEAATAAVQAVSANGKTKVQVRVAVPEGRLRRVAVGQRVTVTGAAFSAASYTGTVVALGAAAYQNPAGSTVVDAVIGLDAADASLKCGLSARAGICVGSADGVIIPYEALMADDDGREYVYLLKNGRALRADVTVAEELAEGVWISEGVAPGDWLIDDPAAVSRNGTRVRVEAQHG